MFCTLGPIMDNCKCQFIGLFLQLIYFLLAASLLRLHDYCHLLSKYLVMMMMMMSRDIMPSACNRRL